MAIKTNQTTDTLTPSTGTIIVNSTGALEVPAGNTLQRPVTPGAGALRFDSSSSTLDIFDGSLWNTLVSLSYVDTTATNLQTQINNIVSNLDPATLDSLTEIVAAFQSEDNTLLSLINTANTNISTLQTDLTQEISNRQFADTLATTARATEVTNRTNADTLLQTNITAEETARIAQDNQLALDIQQETSDRQTAISALDTAITNEETARIAADTTHTANITTLSGDLNTEISDRQTAITNEANARIAGDAQSGADISTLTTNLATEVTDRTNADTTLQNNIDSNSLSILQEIQDRGAADTLLQTNIDTEIIDRTNADTTLQGNIDTEETDRIAADTALQTSITTNTTNLATEVTDRTNADTTLQNNIDAEETARIAGDAGLQTTIDNLELSDLTDVTNTSPTDGQMLGYDGTTGNFRPQTVALAPVNKNYVGDGTTLQFDLGQDVPSPNNLVVVVDGIAQKPLYSYVVTNGDKLVFDEAPESGSIVEVRILVGQSTTDRPRPKISNIAYSETAAPVFNLITFNVTEMTYGFGAKIGTVPIAHIEYPSAGSMQLKTAETFTGNQSITLIDNSGNEFVFEDAFAEPDGTSNPLWTDARKFIGTFSAGDSINYAIGVNSTSTLTLGATSSQETAPTWLSVSGLTLVGTAPTLSSPCRYEFQIIATIGSKSISRNYWLVVI
ncbi:hypothetical protein N9V27_00045 [bacterium]|nr:hypothetical protein [bacterium]